MKGKVISLHVLMARSKLQVSLVHFGFKTIIIMSDSSTTMAESGFCISSASKAFLRSVRRFATECYPNFLSLRFSEHVAIFYYNENSNCFCGQLCVFKGSNSCRNASLDVITRYN